MSDNIETNPIQEGKSKLPIITLAILGLALAGYCIFGLLILLKPDQLSFVEKHFPSPTATLNFTRTPAPASNSTLSSTIVQDIPKEVQILATNSANQWPILFSDTFVTDQKYWNIENVSNEYYDYTLEIKEEKYLWSLTSKQEIFTISSPTITSVTDFHLSAELKLTSGSYKPSYGLVFRENSLGDLYYFGIHGEGFIVDIYYNQAWSRIIEYTKSSAILPQGTNLLSVIAEGSHFVFFINHQFVGEMTDERSTEGITSFGVSFPQGDLQNTFEFDNFILRAP